jgi:ribosomal-protein-alanine N-acetyltransferase
MISPTIITERLILRAMTQEDAELAFLVWGDSETGKYLADPYYTSADELRALFGDIPNWSDYPYLAFERDTNDYVGTCSVGPEERQDEWGIGYCVIKSKQGLGYGTDMARAMIDFAYRCGIHNYTGDVAKENIPSCRIMQKCGMMIDHESSFKKRGTDIVYPSYTFKMHRD